jgi:Tol biopolymer transport system component
VFLGSPVDSLFEAGAADDLVAIAEASLGPRLAMLLPKRGDSSVELTELGGEDDVVSGGQTVQETDALLACTLDLVTDFGKCSHVMRKRRASITHSLLLALIVIAGCSRGGEDHWELAYGVVRDDVPTRIIVMEDDGSDALRVTGARRGASPVLPRWSRDGQRLAFVRFRPQGGPQSLEVYVVNADGSDERLVGEGTLPSWTNDGRFLVVERPRAFPQKSTIHVLPVGGGTGRLLTEGNSAVLSSDGSKVAFIRYEYVRRANGDCCDFRSSTLYTISLDGTGLRRIAQIKSRSSRFVQPLWLPDDSGIAVIERNARLGGPLVTYSLQGQRRVVVPNVGETYDWSPTGDLVAYTRDTILYLIRPDGTEVDSFGQSNAIDIEFSPDGRIVAFSMLEQLESGQFVGIYTVDLDEENTRQRIALADGYVAYMDWRPEPER